MGKKQTILIADDVEVNRAILREMFEGQYSILEAKNGVEALSFLKKDDSIVIVLLDIMMPVADGFFVLEQMKELNFITRIPVIFITGADSIEFEQRGFDLGVTEVVSKPFNPLIVTKRVKNAIALYEEKNNTEKLAKNLTEKLQKTKDDMIDGFAGLVETRNQETEAHIYNIKYATEIILDEYAKGREGEYTPDIKNLIVKASALHDIGKIAVKEEILNKPRSAGRLTDEEYAEMKEHTTKGVDILKKRFRSLVNDNPIFYKYCMDICESHHERWDGKGYPHGLKGDEIPFCAQIVSVADVYDALVSWRCYKDPIPHDKAVEMINNNECGVFNPELLSVFNRIALKLKDYYILLNKEQEQGLEFDEFGNAIKNNE